MRALQTEAVPKEGVDRFFDVLAAAGNVSEATRAIGVSRQWAYDMRHRNARFRERWDAVAEGRRAVLQMKVDAHIESHLDHDWTYLRDGDGELVLDEDFEPVRVSAIPARDLPALRRALGGEAPTVAIQNNVQVDQGPRPSVSVRSAAEAFEAEPEEATHG